MNGVRYFQCDHGKATFYPVARLQPDQRYGDSAPAHGFPAQAGINRVLIVILSLYLLPPLQLYKCQSKRTLIKQQCHSHATTWVIRRVSRVTRTHATWTPLSLDYLPSAISLMTCSWKIVTALLTSTDRPSVTCSGRESSTHSES